MRTLTLLALSAITLAAAGCAGGHRKTTPPPHWVQQANAVCKRDDPRAESGDFDSAAMIDGLRREATDLARVGFFRRIPAAAIDVEIAGRLLFGARGESGPLRRADRALLSARRAAKRRGVHCSFAAVPLGNL
jgi:hypothetical protein